MGLIDARGKASPSLIAVTKLQMSAGETTITTVVDNQTDQKATGASLPPVGGRTPVACVYSNGINNTDQRRTPFAGCGNSKFFALNKRKEICLTNGTAQGMPLYGELCSSYYSTFKVKLL